MRVSLKIKLMKSLREISCNVKKLSNILTRSMLGRIFLKSVLLQSHSQITINLSLVVVVVFFYIFKLFPHVYNVKAI